MIAQVPVGLWTALGGVIGGIVGGIALVRRERIARQPEADRTAVDGWRDLAARLGAEIAELKVELLACNERHRQSDARVAELERDVRQMHEWAKGHAEGQIRSRKDDDE